MEPSADATEPAHALSCYECKRRKVRCDRRLPPCTPCRKAARECQYPLHQLKPGPKQGTIRRQSPSRKRSRLQSDTTRLSCNEDISLQRTPVEDSPEVVFSDYTYPSHEDQNRLSNVGERQDIVATPPCIPNILDRVIQGLNITSERYYHLLTLYFSNMTAFSLFSRQMIDQKISATAKVVDAEALLAAMFSFAARFEEANSSHPLTTSAHYAETTAQKLDASLDGCGDETPPLQVLQAYVLLAFFELTHSVRSKSWRVLGQCIRLAYEMRLHMLDEDLVDVQGARGPLEHVNLEDWCIREEKRRVWWAIWEMDVFASTIRRLPTAIDWSQNLTLLPVADRHWLAKSYHRSCFLLPDSSLRWKRLLEAGNESAKAWFILINSFMRNTQVLVYCRSTSEAERNAHDRQVDLICMANNLYCTVSSLPAKLVYNGERLTFPPSNNCPADESELQLHSDIYSIHLMTQLCHFMINHHEISAQAPWLPQEEHDPREPSIHTPPGDLSKKTNPEWTRYMSAAEEIVTIVRNSARHHYRYVNPFLVNTLWFGAAAQCSCRVFSPSTLAWQRRLADSNLELLRINIENFIKFWNITEMLKSKLARMEFGLIGLMQRRTQHSLNGQQPQMEQTIHPDSQRQGQVVEVSNEESGGTATAVNTNETFSEGTMMFGDWLPTFPGAHDSYQNIFDNTSDPFPYGLDDLLAPYNI